MKMLFTSVGRRAELMQAFRKAADELKTSGGLQDDLTIIGADITDTAPALYVCDETRIVPRIKGESYIPVLLEICQEEAVNCLIPTIDTDLLLAENKQRFESIGAKVLITAADKVRLCRDKNFTAPLSIKAGADSAKAVIRMLNGEKLRYVEKAAKDGAVYSRFDQSICVNE